VTTALDDKLATATRQIIVGWSALSVDIETNPANGDRIFKIGAVRSDGDGVVSLSTGRLDPVDVVRGVNAVSTGAKLLVGHNLRRHDVPQLRRQYAELACLDLPILDTLELSAIAFPANPYHRLVKGYKLISDSRNDPVKDARLALDLLSEEVDALFDMQRIDPEWVALLHFLLRDDRPLAHLLATIRAAAAPERAEATAAALRRFGPVCCSTRLSRFGELDVDGGAEHSMALAHALGWIRVSGGNSVLPIWVHSAIPEVRSLIGDLRERNCGQTGCRYCQEQHHPESLLFTHFQKPTFRERPSAPDGTSLQRAIVVAGLERKSVLAVLPTGGGKSICYQLPALVHYRRAGQLTVIVSPLQSLMKDQVDNLVAAGVTCAVTINGLLTPLERRAALDKIRLGDAGIVLVSPEQFRSRTFADAIRMREIATWVFDEAHCLSKWGHDFRTDYLYVSRFIREHFAAQRAPIACFTATAKPDVIDDLCAHFREGLGFELERFLGGHERENLSYVVVPVSKAQKAQRVVELLKHELRHGGAAVVFCATRKTAQTMSELVTAAGTVCGCFHGGLEPETKKSVQQRFIEGDIPVIAATNAFGMGVDKPDIRVVIHADIPGSLENYLQEAGRAGRDGLAARCVLLFDQEDVETQFRLSASSKLTKKDFDSLLKAIRNRVKRLKTPEIVVSAKELLSESAGTTIDIESRDAPTKVTTAIAWLERSGFLKRNENNSRVEYRHVIVMDCADWRWSGEDERRLLYVAMTRAKETLTLMRAEGGRNPYFVDLGTVEGVIDTLPRQRPEHRQDINLRYVTLGPADVDIGFAGRFRAHDPVHKNIASLAQGEAVVINDRQVKTLDGRTVGRLASKTALISSTPVTGSVSGVLVRTRDQTPTEYRTSVKVERWEAVLLELVVPEGHPPAATPG